MVPPSVGLLAVRLQVGHWGSRAGSYQSSGAVVLASQLGTLSISGKNYGGKVSSVVLASVTEHLDKFSFTVSARHLLGALAVFSGDVTVSVVSDVLHVRDTEGKCAVAVLAKGSDE